MMTAIGLSGFILHAVVFFEGAILYMQLATLAVIYIVLALGLSRRQLIDDAPCRT
jgi:MFS superfamily sulfate permease-like transporter